MKKSALFWLLCASCTWFSPVMCQMTCGYMEKEIVFTKNNSSHIANGGTFTPRGDIRALVVFVSYGDTYDTMQIDGWPMDSELPEWATDSSRQPFYTDISEFSDDIYSDQNRFSVSNFYYQMSHGAFRLMADLYPHRVVVDVSRTDSWGDINRKVIDQIADSVDWSLYDSRKNRPDYQFDNSNTPPDSIIDYIVFCHRFSWRWNILPSDSLSNPGASAYATILTDNIRMNNGYSLISDGGYTFFTGNLPPIGVFPSVRPSATFEVKRRP